jgi:hypothetical protein
MSTFVIYFHLSFAVFFSQRRVVVKTIFCGSILRRVKCFCGHSSGQTLLWESKPRWWKSSFSHTNKPWQIVGRIVPNVQSYATALTKIVFLKLRFISIRKERFPKEIAALGHRLCYVLFQRRKHLEFLYISINLF